MLEHCRVACHQRRGGEAEDLPEREVPGHHREHDADRIESDEALAGLGLHRLAGEEFLGIVRIELTGQRAFLRFANTVTHGLAHFLCHETRVGFGVLAQNPCGASHPSRAFFERGSPPGEKRFMGLADDVVDLGTRRLCIGLERLAGRGVDRFDCHGGTSNEIHAQTHVGPAGAPRLASLPPDCRLAPLGRLGRRVRCQSIPSPSSRDASASAQGRSIFSARS